MPSSSRAFSPGIARGLDPDQLRVASDRNAINPYTGQMEFDDEEDANTNNSYFPGNAYSSPPNNLPGRWISPYNSPGCFLSWQK